MICIKKRGIVWEVTGDVVVSMRTFVGSSDDSFKGSSGNLIRLKGSRGTSGEYHRIKRAIEGAQGLAQDFQRVRVSSVGSSGGRYPGFLVGLQFLVGWP